tara:strand:+ start:172 stop:462 length:291 start_codon:yes stop_codon:yes gene_type:complete
MARWIKFSDRMPTEADADPDKKVIGKGAGGNWCVTYLADVCIFPDQYADHFWLASVPQPRTLEDVVREYLAASGDVGRRLELQKEMREILQKGQDK